MHRRLLTIYRILLLLYAACISATVNAFQFQPGIGVGAMYTDNATLVPVDELEDTIALGYAGASLVETEGALTGDIQASLNHHRYTKDTYNDARYFDMSATLNWEMIKHRFNWYLQDFYTQRPIDLRDPTTPANIQDTNIFAFGARMTYPASARNIFSLIPEYRRFYYESISPDNQQLSVIGSWSYQVTRLTSAGLSISAREVDYEDPLVEDVTFITPTFVVNTIGARSTLRGNLGATFVEREHGQSGDGFSGNIDWLIEMTSHSQFRTYMSSELTDTSSSTFGSTVEPGTGNPNDIAITTDVIRNKIARVEYLRQDRTLDTTLYGDISEVDYSETPNDSRSRTLGGAMTYPVTALTTTGINVRFREYEFVNTARIDDRYLLSASLNYQFTRKLRTVAEVQYRKQDSNIQINDFDEFTAYLGLIYGFGDIMRPTDFAGGF